MQCFNDCLPASRALYDIKFFIMVKIVINPLFENTNFQNCQHIDNGRFISVVCVIMSFYNGNLQVLLTEGLDKENNFVLPVGMLGSKENLNEAARRIVLSLTGCNVKYLNQLKIFDCYEESVLQEKINIAYLALINREEYYMTADGIMKKANWLKVAERDRLSSHLREIIQYSLEAIRSKPVCSSIVCSLLSERFTFPNLISFYEEVLGRKVDRSNFRNKILAMKILSKINEKQYGTSQRVASLYIFNSESGNRQEGNNWMRQV